VSTLLDSGLGRLLVERRLLTPAQLDEALREAGAEQPPRALSEVVIARGWLDRAQMAETLTLHEAAQATERLAAGGGGMAAPTIVDSAAASAPALEPGRRLGEYEAVEVIGRGGMGVVYKAWHPGLKCHFAVKALHGGHRATGDSVQRLRQEAQVLARLRHPGIVGVNDVWEEAGATYLAMDFVAGRSLDARVAEGHVAAADAIRWTGEIAEAIAHAHEGGILHRDLKPANVLLDAHGRVKVMDFGLARIVDAGEARVTRTGILMGTPAYMSPEQVESGMGAVDAQSDVYQVGAILYELLTGRAPYEGDGSMAILMQVARDDPRPPRTLRPEIDRNAETVCLRAMSRERRTRYASARALAEDCRRFLAGEPIRASRPPAWEKAVRWTRRHRALAALATAILLALAAAGGSTLRARTVEREKADLEAQVLRALRMLALTHLEATLMVRRVGGSLREAEARFLGPLEEAAHEAERKLPTLAEPHYHLGVMYRALLRFDDAAAQQETASAKDPTDPRVLYERAILAAHRYGQRLARLREVWSRAEGRRLAVGGRIESGDAARADARSRPTDDALAAADSEARALHARIVADLERLETLAAPAGFPAAMLACARGIFLSHSAAADQRTGAIDLLESAVRADSSLEEAHERLAQLHLGRDDFARAIEAFTRAIAADKGFVPFWLGRAEAQLTWGLSEFGHGADPADRFRAAESDLDRAIELDPDSPIGWSRRGKLRNDRALAVERGGGDPAPDYRSAIEDYTKALALDAKTAETWRRRANSHADWGLYDFCRGIDPRAEWQAALVDYAESLRLGPGDGETWMDRGNLRMNWAAWTQGQGGDPTSLYREAEADAGESLQRDPSVPDAWMWRGMLRSNWGVYHDQAGLDPIPLYEAAAGDFAKALELQSRFAKAWMWQGNVSLNRGLYDQMRGRDPEPWYDRAVTDLTRAIELNPALAEAWTMRGRVQTHRGVWWEVTGRDPGPVYAPAIADLGKALDVNPSYHDGWITRGMARVNWGIYRYRRGQDPTALWTEAVADYGRAVEINPGAAEGWMRRGKVRSNLGVYAQEHGADAARFYRDAVADYERAGALNPRAAEVWSNLAMARMNWGNAQVGTENPGGGVAPGEEPESLYAGAVQAYEKALLLNPQLVQARVGLAVARVNWGRVVHRRGGDPTGQWDAAITDYGRAAELNPRSAEIFEGRGTVKTCVGEWRTRHGGDARAILLEAVEDFGRALALHPKNAEAFWRRGLAETALARWADAVADFEAALALNPECGPAFARALDEARRRMREK